MIDKIVRNGVCLGCGLCSSVLGEDKCSIRLYSDGFYYPQVKDKDVDDEVIGRICPGIQVNDTRKHGVWGHIENVAEAWATDKALRHKAASGGVSSALALFLLEKKVVDAILQVGVVEGDYLHNELKVSKTSEDIIKNAQSRYAPALSLIYLKQILDNSSSTYAYIGKPCDIAAIRNFQAAFPQYQGRILYTISIFCAGMPSYNATDKTWQQSGLKDNPVFLKYRGEGWPGSFKAVWSDGQEFETSYNDSWGNVLGRNLNFRCKVCPDGIGLLADIAVGDSWNTKNGYPDFTESDGRNFCFIRSSKGQELFSDAVKAGYLESQFFEVSKVRDMQKYQYDRRHIVGWRIMAANLSLKGLLKFDGLGLIALALKSNKWRGLKEAKGTITRIRNEKNRMASLLASEGKD